MSVYLIVQLKFTQRAAYDRYLSRFAEVFSRFQGRLLAADERPQVLEGEWPRDKVVLMSFPDPQAYRDWAESPAYQAIAPDRQAGAEAVVLLVRGIEGLRS